MPSGSAVHVNPNLTVGSRIQVPTNLPAEPFRYGVIRWIGEQDMVAGIEMASAQFYRILEITIITGEKFHQG